MPLAPRDSRGRPDEWTAVEKTILERRSVRNFTEEDVPETLIRRVLEAGRFAPSAGNNQPWKFKVIDEMGEYFIDPESYARYDLAAEVFASLDTKGCVTLYRQLKPAIQEAYKDLGYPNADFDDTLKKAIMELLKVPVIEENIKLEKKVLTYMMVDSSLETLSFAQKHLLRMGPDNVRVIQGKLRSFALSLGFSE